MGLCYLQLGDRSLAWFSIGAALAAGSAEAGRALSQQNHQEALRLHQRLESQLSRVEVEFTSPSWLRLDQRALVKGSGADVYVRSPDSNTEDVWFSGRVVLFVNPGERSLTFGHEGEEQTIRIALSAGATVRVQQPRASKLPAPQSSALQPLALPTPEARPAGTTSAAEMQHLKRSEAQAPRGLSQRELWLKRAQWGGFGLAGAGAVVAMVSGIMRANMKATLSEACDADGWCPPSMDDEVLRYRRTSTWTNIGVWTGIAGSALGVSATIWRAQLNKSPVALTAGLGQVNLKGRF
jgi:hypothetical protein